VQRLLHRRLGPAQHDDVQLRAVTHVPVGRVRRGPGALRRPGQHQGVAVHQVRHTGVQLQELWQQALLRGSREAVRRLRTVQP